MMGGLFSLHGPFHHFLTLENNFDERFFFFQIPDSLETTNFVFFSRKISISSLFFSKSQRPQFVLSMSKSVAPHP